jgi:hypothetical protein
MFLGRCYDCKRIRMTGLPSDYDRGWLTRYPHLSVEWRCRTCNKIGRIELGMEQKTVEVVERRVYLIKMREVLPLLTSVAVIVMTCLEIAWHT